MDVLPEIDTWLPRRALIFGSLPPEARDLDILVRDDDLELFRGSMSANGFDPYGHSWVRFERCRVDVVDAIPASDWGLSTVALDRLFEDSVAIEGTEKLARPAPHHLLLILAYRLTLGATDIALSKRTRIDEATRGTDDAWATAATIAPEWRLSTALGLLKESVDSGHPVSRDGLVQARMERATPERRGALTRITRRARATIKSGPALVTLSGLDGSGKSSQAQALSVTLTTLGLDAGVEWNRLAQDPILDAIAVPIKRALGKGKPHRKGDGGSTAPTRRSEEHDVRRGPIVTFFWTIVVALANGIAHRRDVGRHRRKGRIVVCDRYVLDSAVHMTRKYGLDRSYRLQIALIKLLSPRPTISFFLDIPPETSVERKQDVYSLEQLRQHAALYGRMIEAFDAIPIDGTQPMEKICEQIARRTWDQLTGGPTSPA